MPFRNTALLFSSILLTASGLLADVVQQSPSFTGTGTAQACACWTSQYATDISGGYQTFDAFTPSSVATVLSVSWQGLYWDYQNLSSTPASPDTNSWEFQFWSSALGIPGTLLQSQTVSTSGVTASWVGTTSELGSPSNVYSFLAPLSPSFSVNAGQTYFFSVISLQTNSDPLFAWTKSNGGDGLSMQEGSGTISLSGFLVSRPSDRAFDLSTFGIGSGSGGPAPTPEPGSLVLVVAGLAVLGIGLRSRTRS